MYFEGQLSPDKIKLFNKQLQTDPDFAKLFDNYKLAHKAKDLLYAAQAHDHIKGTTESKAGSSRNKKLWTLLSLLVAGLLAITVFQLFFKSDTPKKSQVVEAYLLPYSNTVRGSENLSHINQLEQFVYDKDFDACINYYLGLKKVEVQIDEDIYASFCYLNVEKFDEALQLNSKSMSRALGENKLKILLNRSVILLMQGNQEAAMKILDQLDAGSGFYAQKARQLKGRINSN